MIRLQERAMNHHQRIREFYSDLSAAQWYDCSVETKQEVLNLFWSSLDFKDYNSDIEKDRRFLTRAKDILEYMVDSIHRNRMWNNVGAVANGLAALISPIALINLAVGGVNLLASSSLKELEQKLTALKNKAGELLNNL